MILSMRCKESAHPEMERAIMKSTVTDFMEFLDGFINAVQVNDSSEEDDYSTFLSKLCSNS